MTNYFEAPDGHDEPTLWAVSGNQHAVPVLRRSDVPKFWPDIVARMTGTTQTQLETAKVQLKTMSGVVDRLRADIRTWQRAAAERTRERDEATDQLEATIRARDAYRADRDDLSELLAKANDGTTITADDVHRAVDAARAAYWDVDNGEPPSLAMYEAAILAALTGVPHD